MVFKKLLLPFLLCLALNSCLELKFLGTIDQSGAGEMTVVTEVPARNPLNQEEPLPTQGQLDAERDIFLTEEKQKADKVGVQITDCRVELEGDKKLQSTTLKFDNLKELNDYFNLDDKSKTEITLKSSGRNTTFSHKVTVPEIEQQEPQQQAVLNELMDKSRVTVSWRFPAEAGVISEGGVVSDDGRTVNWEMSLRTLAEEGIDVFATFATPMETEDARVIVLSEEEDDSVLVIYEITLFDVMLFLSILGAIVIVFLVVLKIRVSRQNQ